MFHILQSNCFSFRNGINSFCYVEARNLELLGIAKFAVRLEVLLAEEILLLILGSQHHRGVFIWTASTFSALQADFVVEDIGYLHRVIWIGLPVTLGASSLFLGPLCLLFFSLLLLLSSSDVFWCDNTPIGSRRVFLKFQALDIHDQTDEKTPNALLLLK